MTKNYPITVRNETAGVEYLVTEWSVTRSILQCFSSGTFAVKIGSDFRLQDEISLSVVSPAGSTLELAYGRVKTLDFDDGNAVTIGWQSKAGVMAENDAEPNDWTYNTAREVIEAVAGEFDVDVTWDASITPDAVPGNIVIDPGSKALGVIIEICKANGWILMDFQGGGLGVTTVGNVTYPLPLARGVPPFFGGSLSAEDKRIAVVRANRQMPGEQRRGKKTIEDIDLWGEATDEHALAGTRRYLRSDKAGSVQELDFLAAVTSLLEGAGGIRYTINVQGLFALDGELWQINHIVTVSDPERGVVSWPGLIDSITMSQSAGSAQRTKMTLVPPAIYYSENPDAIEGMTGTDPFRGLNVWR